jgi:hypothetical protein
MLFEMAAFPRTPGSPTPESSQPAERRGELLLLPGKFLPAGDLRRHPSPLRSRREISPSYFPKQAQEDSLSQALEARVISSVALLHVSGRTRGAMKEEAEGNLVLEKPRAPKVK